MKIRVIVAQTFDSGGKHVTEPLGSGYSIFEFRQILEALVQLQESIRQKFKLLAAQQSRFFLGVRLVSSRGFGRKFTR
jgi:hypothetical protein